MKNNWHLTSWRYFPAKQQPSWPNHHLYEGILRELSELPPIVDPTEIRAFTEEIADVVQGKTFILQMGDCAEEFKNCNREHIQQRVDFIAEMAGIIAKASGKRVLKIGRIAGQYAKSRSSEFENVDGQVIPIFRGDMVNGQEATSESRTPDPMRLLEGYQCSKKTKQIMDELELVKKPATSWAKVSTQKAVAFANASTGTSLETYDKAESYLSDNVQRAINNDHRIYTSHEGLLLGYEESMTRKDTFGEWFNTGAHMVWVGERTREPGSAHVEYARGISNPVGLKIGPDYSLGQIRDVIEKLNPKNSSSRLVLITRFGANKIEKFLPGLIRDIKSNGYNVAWVCDPMHGNTFQGSSSSLKTRDFSHVLKEVKLFFEIHRSMGTIPCGLHLETTVEDVSECIGGPGNITEADLGKKYKSVCDPRLNYDQVHELITEVATLFQ